MDIFKFYVIIENIIVGQRRMLLRDCFPKWLRDKLGQYVSLRTSIGLSWIVSVVKRSDKLVYLDGDDLFKVIICGQSVMGIHYPTSKLASQTSLELEREEVKTDLINRQKIEPLVDGVVPPMECTFTRIMTASDLSGRQTIVSLINGDVSLLMVKLQKKLAFQKIFAKVTGKEPYALRGGNMH
ncbi:hypothetical protein ACFE04_005790 [Oxalis oulophora]